jgi:hypothetical protein
MIVQHVTRERLGGSLHHPLKYADLAACLEEVGAERVYLSVRFVGTPSAASPEYREKSRSEPVREQHELVQIHYHPSAHRVEVEGTPPWEGVTDPVVVFVDIWPVERDVTQWLPRLRSFLAGLVKANITGLLPNGLPASRFLLHASLLSETSEIEVGTTTWTELRRNQEAVHAVAIP